MIIVTGGAGFIGSAIVAELNNRQIEDIVVVDELGNDNKWKNLRNLSFTDYVEKDDFLELIMHDQIDDSVEAIIHLGACSDTTETNASYLAKNNYEYTKILASWAVDADVRFIYASSAATYGDGENGFIDNEFEIENLKPLNMYGYSKQLFDVWAYKNSMLDQIVGLKYFNVFGPNEYHKANMRSFILKSFEQIKENGMVNLFKSYHPDYKDGEQVRDFIYVKDAVDMTLFFLENPEANGIYNVGTATPRTWVDLVNAVFAAMGEEPNIEFVEMPDSIKNQYQYYTCADITKIREAGYDKQTTSLEDSIKDYVQNYLQKDEYL